MSAYVEYADFVLKELGPADDILRTHRAELFWECVLGGLGVENLPLDIHRCSSLFSGVLCGDEKVGSVIVHWGWMEDVGKGGKARLEKGSVETVFVREVEESMRIGRSRNLATTLYKSMSYYPI